MRNKRLIFSVLAAASVMVVAVVVMAASLFLFAADSAAQTEEVRIDRSLDAAPVQVEPVSVEKPVLNYGETSYAAGHDGGCPFGASKMQLTETHTDQIEQDQLLTLAE